MQPELPSYINLRAKLRLNMKQESQVKEKILATYNKSLEQAIHDNKIVLARSEKKRLFVELLEELLTEIINESKSASR